MRRPVTPGLSVLQVNTLEHDGGAARIASDLTRRLVERGCDVSMAVGRKASDNPRVVVIPDEDRALYRAAGYTALQRVLQRRASKRPGSGWGLASRTLRAATHPRVFPARAAGLEDFEFPGTSHLLDLTSRTPEIVHCHNLHGGYFDLRALTSVSRRVPVVLTLHDMWMFTGHCAHAVGCDRWSAGCGSCPDLQAYPAVRKDATATNWQRKRDIYARSRLYVTTPSRWLMQKVEQSMLDTPAERRRVIPNGVDLQMFYPGERRVARAALNLPSDAPVVLVVSGRRDEWLDEAMLGAALEKISARFGGAITFLCVGEARGLRTARAPIRWIPYQHDRTAMAQCYRAADIFLHASSAATFPTTILESLACGTPVVAANVGGISEQIVPHETGFLAPSGDADRAAQLVLAMLNDGDLRDRVGRNAAQNARERFDLDRQVDAYLAWYRAIIGDWNGNAHPALHHDRDAVP